jgi:hypothetical protein
MKRFLWYVYKASALLPMLCLLVQHVQSFSLAYILNIILGQVFDTHQIMKVKPNLLFSVKIKASLTKSYFFDQ